MESKFISDFDEKKHVTNAILELEGKMLQQYPKDKILRLMCLYSTIQGGLKPPLFKRLRECYIVNYGHQEIVTLMNLQ